MRGVKSSAAVLVSRDRPGEHRQLACQHAADPAEVGKIGATPGTAKSVAARATAAWNLFNGAPSQGIIARKPRGSLTGIRHASPHVPSSSVLSRKPPTSPDLGTRMLTAAQRARVALAAAEERAALLALRPSPSSTASTTASSGIISRPNSALCSDRAQPGPASPWQPPVAQISLDPSIPDAFHQREAPLTESYAALPAPAQTAQVAPHGCSDAARLDRTGNVVRQRQQQPRQQQLPPRRRSTQTERCKEGGIDEACRVMQNEVLSKGLAVSERTLPDLDRVPPVLLGHPLSRKDIAPVSLEPKCHVDTETSCPESIFDAMERLGQAARNRGQHSLVKGSRGKRLVRFDRLQNRSSPQAEEKLRRSVEAAKPATCRDLFNARQSWVQHC